jgi:DNA repair protein RadC
MALKQALEAIDVRVVAHFVIAGTQAMSFAECGRI